MKSTDLATAKFTNVQHLPIVKEYARQIKLTETIDSMVESQMELSPGVAVLAMVLDTLTGRTPLYRLVNFYSNKDSKLLLGEPVEPELFSDHNLGRVLDKIYEAGTQKIFGQLSQNAVGGFQIDTRCGHYDTTSISVFGDYDLAEHPFKITYGHSKDKRPDLKQFLIEMLCVDRNIPILGATRNGNGSDKTLNNELLSGISRYMSKNGLKDEAYIHVADAAMVTGDNLEMAALRNILFLSRLPANFTECGRAIKEAVAQNQWEDIGRLNQTPATKKRPAAFYRAFETTVEINGRTYRAIVVHSSAHDKRRHKKIDRLLKKELKELTEICKKAKKTPYFCQADAQVAEKRLFESAQSLECYTILTTIEEVAKYKRGRPAQGREREIDHYEYVLKAEIVENAEKVKTLRSEAGCFVLLTNLNSEKQRQEWGSGRLLRLYKDQSGIEQNFGFLKDPAIVNGIFLKKTTRIEVLGLILLIALLIWRLMERAMRQFAQPDGSTLPGWEERKTKRPTSFMMTTKFTDVLVITIGKVRRLANQFTDVQLAYLKALKVNPDAFVTP
jgi:transposase